ncbi:TPA: hypothetical protein ACPUMH_002044 [Klebsiella pneumoniae]
MTLKNIGDVSSQVKNFGEPLRNDTDGLLRSLKEHWQKRDYFHDFIIISEKNSSLRIEMPEFKFWCESKQRFVFLDRDLVCEIAFYTCKEEKEIPIFTCFLRPGGELSFDTPESEETFNIYYARNVESAMIDKIIQNASIKKFISL